MTYQEPASAVIVGLYLRHMNAFEKGNEDERKRLFDLIKELRWACPHAAAEVDFLYLRNNPPK